MTPEERKTPAPENDAHRKHTQEPERTAGQPDVEQPEEGSDTAPGSTSAAHHDLDVDAIAAEKARQSTQPDADSPDVEDQSAHAGAASDSAAAEDESADKSSPFIEELQRRKPK